MLSLIKVLLQQRFNGLLIHFDKKPPPKRYCLHFCTVTRISIIFFHYQRGESFALQHLARVSSEMVLLHQCPS